MLNFACLRAFVGPAGARDEFSLLSWGCATSARDTEGHTFEIDCSKRPCKLIVQSSASASAPPHPAEYLLEADGRYLLACAPEQTEFDCRPIQCRDSDPCGALGGSAFTCSHGLCAARSRSLTEQDRLAVCLAGTGRWLGTPEQRSRLTLAHSSRHLDQPPAVCVEAALEHEPE